MIPQLETKQLKSFFILIIGGILIKSLYNLWYSTFIFQNIFISFLWVIFLFLFLFNFFSDKREFKKLKTKSSYLSSYFGVSLFIISIFIHFSIIFTFNSENLIRAHYSGDYNGVTYYFKSNGTLIIENGGGLGSDYKYGKYTITDSVITVKINGEFTSDELIIIENEIKFKKHNRKEDLANQLTTKGNGVNREIELKIIEDNR